MFPHRIVYLSSIVGRAAASPQPLISLHFRGRRDYSGLTSLRSVHFRKGQGGGLAARVPAPYGAPLRRFMAARGALPPENGGGQKGGVYEDGLSSVRWQVQVHGHVYG